MKHPFRFPIGCSVAAVSVWIVLGACAPGRVQSHDRLEVPYEPTHPLVVDLMLGAVPLTGHDVLYDLGCGDGRIPVAAVRRSAARAVCVDIDERRIDEAREKARHYGVADRIDFVVGDLFFVDLRPATVVTIYLTTRLNRWLRRRLLRLAPGTRVVSHAFGMSEWQPDRVLKHERARHGRVYYYVVPAPMGGHYSFVLRDGRSSWTGTVTFTQEFQFFTGQARLNGTPVGIRDGRLIGRELRFTLLLPEGAVVCRGTAEEDLRGTCSLPGKTGLSVEPRTFRASRRSPPGG